MHRCHFFAALSLKSISSIQAHTHVTSFHTSAYMQSSSCPFARAKKAFDPAKIENGMDGVGVRMYGWMCGRAFSLIVCYFIYLFIFPRLPKKCTPSTRSPSPSPSHASTPFLPFFLSFFASPYCFSLLSCLCLCLCLYPLLSPSLVLFLCSFNIIHTHTHTRTLAHTNIDPNCQPLPSGRGEKKKRGKGRGEGTMHEAQA